MKLVDRLDHWWQSKSEGRRLDRAPANLGLTVGLMFPCLSIVLRGPSPTSFLSSMDNVTQIAMCAMIFTGLAICLHGMILGSRWYFPHATLVRCYRKAMYGGPLAIVGLAVYTYFLVIGTPNVWGTLNVFLTPALGLAVAGQCLLYWLDMRRIAKNKTLFTETAKVRVQVENESHDDS